MTSVPGRIGAGVSAPIGSAVVRAVGWTTARLVGDALGVVITDGVGEERSPLVGVVSICGAVVVARGAAGKAVAGCASEVYVVGAAQLASSMNAISALARKN